jgi:AraC family ethanolamine operon transcriptional activator
MRSQVFDDFDAFAESVRGVESKMLLRNPQRRIWSTSSVDLGRIDVQLGRLGSGNIAQGELRPDGYMLYLPLSDAVEYSANGVVLPDKSFAILEPGCEFCISTKVKHDWCVAFIPTALFAQADDSARRTSRSCRVTRPCRQAADEFRATLLQIFDTAAATSHFESSPAAQHAAENVLRVAKSIVAPSQPVETKDEGRPRVPRHEIIRSSLEWLAQQAGEPVSVQDLAAIAAVSERTLRTAFNEFFGVGPVRYLQLRHLHHVHRALKLADPERVTVSQVLVEQGEWAFGRFASRYRRLFGELPSETLRKKTF